MLTGGENVDFFMDLGCARGNLKVDIPYRMRKGRWQAAGSGVRASCRSGFTNRHDDARNLPCCVTGSGWIAGMLLTLVFAG